jgi:hypothetical protein
MQEIKVLITGMFLLVAPKAYVPSSNVVDINAAVAVEGGAPFGSAYNVDIPLHHAKLTWTPGDVSVTVDIDQRVGTGELRLEGDHIQFGNVMSSACRANNPTTSPMTGDSMRSLPHLSALVTMPVLRDDAKPANGTDFTNVVKADRVAAWLDMPTGIVRAHHSGNREDDQVEFRPSGTTAALSRTVLWRLDRKDADCVLITPFASTGKAITLTLVSKNVTFTLENVADEDTGDMVPGIGYDYELLYRLLVTPPVVPPIPYASKRPTANSTGPKAHADAGTGVNCGPTSLP